MNSNSQEHPAFLPNNNSLFGPLAPTTQAEGEGNMSSANDSSFDPNLGTMASSQIEQEQTVEDDHDGHDDHPSRSATRSPTGDDWDGEDIYNDDRNITPADYEAPYALREGIEREAFRGSGFEDIDESGTYDPNHKSPRKPKRQQLSKNKFNFAVADYGDDGKDDEDTEDKENKIAAKGKKRKAVSHAQGRKEGRSMLAACKLTTQKGIESSGVLIESFKTKPETEKEGNGGHDEHIELKCSDQGHGKGNKMSPMVFGAYNEDFYTGPDSTKCVECEDSDWCSLQTNPTKYPCQTCVKFNRTCTKPKFIWKHPCARCRDRRQHCSYADNGGEDGQDCEQCQHSFGKCEPSPPEEESEDESSLKKEYVLGYDEGHYESDVDDFKRRVAAMSCYPRQKSHPEASKKDKMRVSGPAKTEDSGELTRIDTAFCHPITFNHMDQGNGQCHFCGGLSGIRYGLTGLGELNVEVLQWNDAVKGYTEVSGGHAGRGEEATRMCVKCTSWRLQIVNCPQHLLSQILGRDMHTYDGTQAMLNTLEGSSPSDQSGSEERWCSICIEIAFFECCTPQAFLNGIHDDSFQGCGLSLCAECMTLLTDINTDELYECLEIGPLDPFMKVDDVISLVAQDSTPGFPGGLRADSSFLSSSGELIRRFDAEIRKLALDEEEPDLPDQVMEANFAEKIDLEEESMTEQQKTERKKADKQKTSKAKSKSRIEAIDLMGD